MKKTMIPIAAATLLLAACSNEHQAPEGASGEFEPGGNPTDTKQQISVPDTAHFSCDDENPCDFDFKIDSIEAFNECPTGPDKSIEPGPIKEDGKYIILAGEFHNQKSTWGGEMDVTPTWWEVEDSDGFTTQPQPASACETIPVGENLEWLPAPQGGKTKGRMLFQVPANAKHLVLKEIRSDESYEVAIPEAKDTEGGSSAKGTKASSPNPTQGQSEPATQDSTSATDPVPDPGASGMPPELEEQLRQLHEEHSPHGRTTDHCGDPTLHEIGTTFFTDGTSGWSQACADSMMTKFNQNR